MERRYDIDWLRVIAIGLLLIYHIAIGFQPWGIFIGFIMNRPSLETIWVPMSMLNVWRIPLLFFVSGMGLCFAMARRSWKALLAERSRRILLPLLFGAVAIVPLHQLLWQKYYSQDLAFTPGVGHLWFLANIFGYVLLFSPLFYLLQNRKESSWARGLQKIFHLPPGWLIPPALFALETLILKPDSYTLYASTLHGFVLGGLAFLFGYLFVYSGRGFWESLRKWRWIIPALALAMFMHRYLRYDMGGPAWLNAIETCLWVYSMFALGYSYLNKPSATLSYLSQAAYPVYILHMIFLFLASYFIMPMELGAWIKFLLVVLITLSGCMLSYEFLVRRIFFLRPLFGLRSLAPVFNRRRS